MQAEPLPPQDLESERCLLGAHFAPPSEHSDFDLNAIRAIISPEMFYTPQHSALFQAILDTADNDEPVVPASVAARLETADSNGEWRETIADLTVEAESANTLFYAGKIHAAWEKREIIRRCEKAISKACDPNPEISAAAISEELVSRLPQGSEVGTGLVWKRFSEIERRTLEWHWPGRLPKGKVSLIAGVGDLGKSYISLDIAARTSAGRPWPDLRDQPNAPGDALILSAEDDSEDTIGPRLDQCGADSKKVIHLEGVRRPDAKNEIGMFDLTRDLRHVETLLDKTNTKLLVVDPLGAFMGRETDSHVDASVRRTLGPLAELAARRRICVVGVVHLAKAVNPGNAVSRILGSVAFANLARSIWMVFSDPEVPGRRLFLRGKCNLAPADVTGLAYRITDRGVEWEAGAVDLSADDAAMQSPNAKARLVRHDVEDWIRTLLKDGPVPSERANREWAARGFSEPTVKRARRSLGVRTRSMKYGDAMHWIWELPDQKTP